jgi:sterol desaturase/sphingolipid hydroxylase (fatty acid hydroxylase superfamily)
VINDLLENAQSTATELLIAAVPFVLIAAFLKRDQLLPALQRARPEIITNLGLVAVNVLVLIPLLAVPVKYGREIVPRPEVLVGWWTAVPAGLAVLAAILIVDFAAYWRHRFEHSRALWPIHATHHADEAMNWLSVRRKHPLGEALSMILDLLPVIMLGLPYGAIFIAIIMRSAWGYFIHADVPWTLGRFGLVLISPAAHRLHHIRDEKLMGSNYGNTVTIWDQLFGTYVDPAPYVNCETGIAEGTRGLLGELARPFEARYWRRKPEAEPAEQSVSST